MTFDALRQAAQCIGRVIRSKTDYGIVVLADARYVKSDKRSKFPPWINQFVRDSLLNLSTDNAVEQMRKFLRVMGQPIDQEALHSILMDENAVNKHVRTMIGNGHGQRNVDKESMMFEPMPAPLLNDLGPLPSDTRNAPYPPLIANDISTSNSNSAMET
jgi:hypothetical protein